MTKKYLIKREYLGFKEKQYWLRYGDKNILVTMKWVSGEYRILWAKLMKYDPNLNIGEFPYKRTVRTIDRVEALLNMFKEDAKK